RHYQSFTYRDSNFRICSPCFSLVTEEIRRQRELLEAYLLVQPLFRTSFVPIGLLPGAPPIAERMAAAAARVGVGPMAAVAGAIAQASVEAALAGAVKETIVENGGDLYIASDRPVQVGIFAGKNSPFNSLAFALQPGLLPLSLCSSSSKMGHSVSLGHCDLATVAARDAALADAAATLACNLVRSPGDLKPTLERIMTIPGISGVMLVYGDELGLSGEMPPLVKQNAVLNQNLVTRDRNAIFPC
ncbi:MAG: UPF0280 family protein, partial [Lentisphaeria bacterium]|nr:UPF0280 family protein [Lentisphaeria bacterium]